MTEIEKKAEEYARARNCETCYQAHLPPIYCLDAGNHCILCGHDKESYIIGYEQGQKDFDTDVTKLLNSYGIKFIDTNSIGGLIGLHGLMLDLEKENEELKKQIEKMKCCSNCKHYINNGTKWCLQNEGNFFECDLNEDWELAE